MLGRVERQFRVFAAVTQSLCKNTPASAPSRSNHIKLRLVVLIHTTHSSYTLKNSRRWIVLLGRVERQFRVFAAVTQSLCKNTPASAPSRSNHIKLRLVVLIHTTHSSYTLKNSRRWIRTTVGRARIFSPAARRSGITFPF